MNMYVIAKSGLVIFLKDIVKVSTKPFNSEDGLAHELIDNGGNEKTNTFIYVDTKSDGIQNVDLDSKYSRSRFVYGDYCAVDQVFLKFMEVWIQEKEGKDDKHSS